MGKQGATVWKAAKKLLGLTSLTKLGFLADCPRSQPISPDDLDMPEELDPEEIDMPCH